MVKLAAIIILYHPDESVLQHISTYSNYIDCLYIFNNSENNNATYFSEISKAKFFQDGENRGISQRLNEGCRLAIADGYEWALTMDQDTLFDNEHFLNYVRCFENYSDKNRVATFGINYKREAVPPAATCLAETVDSVITSGMLLNLTIWETTHGFDENLFIDSVDHEYCIRVAMRGFRIVKFANIYIRHEVGTLVYRSSIKSLFLLKKKKEIHTPLRCYYMYRNMLYLENKYRHTNPAFATSTRDRVEYHITVCLLYGCQRRAIKQYIQIAKQDFANNCMGKIQVNRLLH